MTAATALDIAREVADVHGVGFLAAADYIDVSFSSGGLAAETQVPERYPLLTIPSAS